MSAGRRELLLRLSGALFVLAMCVFLYVKTQAVDYRAHAEFADALRRVQQLNAVLKQQTLAARFGLLNQYDPLTHSYGELSASVQELAEDLQRITYRDSELEHALTKLTAVHQERQDALESFKSHNSLLKNSLYYLPLAGEELAQALEAEGSEESKAAARSVNALVQATLAHNLLKSEELEKRVHERYAELEQGESRLPPAVRESLALVLRHVQTVMHQQGVVNPLLAHITSAQLDRAALALSAAYGARFEAATRSTNQYRVALYVFMIILLVAVVVVGFKLRAMYANLGQLVRDRTARLDTALRELWGEMALAKKIQTALVPTRPTLRGCEVAAVMRPADQVGGDYYDVLQVGDHEWVLIGDVSGHGVPAGLVMMMCQTAAHTALKSDRELSPDHLLVTINRALTANIRRLGEDKYMTMTALRRSRDGRFRFAGLHQDILIYRAATRSVQTLEATGTCLGLSDSIGGQLPVGEFELGRGDVLLLYTDGITEAVRDGAMFDLAGVQRALEELGHLSADEILSGLLARLADHTVLDDVTALAIKQC